MRTIYKKIALRLPLLLGLSFLSISSMAAVETIMVGGTSFVPVSVTINIGDTILWQWDNGSHTTTSTAIPSGAATWDEPINSSSTTFMYIPTVAGVYSYKCTPHESMGMIGSFTVVCVPPTMPVINPPGSVSGCEGDSGTLLTVSTEAGNEIQWELNNSPIAGAITNQHLPEESGTYTCVVNNACGAEESAPVTVSLEPAPEPAFTYTQDELTFTFENTSANANMVWNWDFGDGNTSGEADPVHMYSAAGMYTVTLTATDTAGSGCSGTITEQVEAQTSGIHELEKPNLVTISPNPAHDWVNITVEEESFSLIVYDLSGKACLSREAIPAESGGVTRVDIGGLAPGLYFLQVRLNDQTLTRKLSVR